MFKKDIERGRMRYGARFDVEGDELMLAGEDMCVLDYNGHTAFNAFSFGELGEMVRHDMTDRLVKAA